MNSLVRGQSAAVRSTGMDLFSLLLLLVCHSVLSGDRIRQCETTSGSCHKDTDQCLYVAISFCRHRSVPFPCENRSVNSPDTWTVVTRVECYCLLHCRLRRTVGCTVTAGVSLTQTHIDQQLRFIVYPVEHKMLVLCLTFQ